MLQMLKHSFLREFTCANFEYLVQQDHITPDEIPQLTVCLEGDPAPAPPRVSVDVFDEIEDDPNFEDNDEGGFGLTWEEGTSISF